MLQCTVGDVEELHEVDHHLALKDYPQRQRSTLEMRSSADVLLKLEPDRQPALQLIVLGPIVAIRKVGCQKASACCSRYGYNQTEHAVRMFGLA